MTSLGIHAEEDNADRCWICLGNAGDWPPMGRPGESRELIQVCDCSLRAHKRCLLNWITEVDQSQRSEGNVAGALSVRSRVFVGVRNDVGISVLGLGAPGGARLLAGEHVLCPQCKRHIIITKAPSDLLRVSALINSAFAKGTRYVSSFVFTTSILSTVTITSFCMFASTGLALWKVIAPQSVLMNVLGIRQRNFDAALNANAVNLRHLCLLAGFPVFLFSSRFDNVFCDLFQILYPTVFGRFDFLLRRASPEQILWLFACARPLYELGFKLTLNRLYYRFCKIVAPSFLGLLPPKVMEGAQDEEMALCELEQRLHDKTCGLPWYQRLYYWAFPPLTATELALMNQNNARERLSCLEVDFSLVFHSTPFFLKLFTTLVWPLAGTLLGTLLRAFTPIDQYLSYIANTPDECTYAGNVIGMGLIPVLRDIWQLLLAWKRTKVHQGVDVVDIDLHGAVVKDITQYVTLPDEPIDGVVAFHTTRNALREHAEEPEQVEGAAPYIEASRLTIIERLGIFFMATLNLVQ